VNPDRTDYREPLMAQQSRVFRVFVSSTFADLKAERNALQERVGSQGTWRRRRSRGSAFIRTHPQSPHPSSAGGDFLFMTLVSSTILLYRNILCRSKPASPRGGFWRVIGSFSPSSASQTCGRGACVLPLSGPHLGGFGLSFSETSGLVPPRPHVENPVFMRVSWGSPSSGFNTAPE